jgi:hypothetical protein
MLVVGRPDPARAFADRIDPQLDAQPLDRGIYRRRKPLSINSIQLRIAWRASIVGLISRFPEASVARGAA